MRNYLKFDNAYSYTYGVYISGQGTFAAPTREYNMLSIPGRNGDLVGTEKRFENIEVTYPAFIYSNFSTNIQNFRNFLLSHFGYFRLEDTYHPDEYRLAVYPGEFEPEVVSMNNAGSFDLVFNCKPQRFLKSGEAVTSITSTGTTVTNPTLFNSQPLLRVYGTGTLEIGTQSITITDADTYTDIDCEMMDCFKGTANKNQYVQFSGHNFPVLKPGGNEFTFGAGITKVEVTPRWWII